MLRNVNPIYLENVLQRNLRTDCARECIFRASGGTNFESFPSDYQPWLCPFEFDVCGSLLKET